MNDGIVIDEFDTIKRFAQEWTTSRLKEAILLLDRSLFRPGFSKSPEADLEVTTRLEESTFIIGANGLWG